ncbi:MAG: 2-C-methyl-D-erythritol 2,4-cyclodiphosphate synthase [Dehalococcoidia bacterium]|nr:MAG: 2-C-methyl-D-erythritol 2,4-cyclodiphosphate synthase [Dehalococcoidia bacterium]
MRTGIGFDVHRLTPDHKLVLGGVEIPFTHGLTGWSDADVLTHAVMDALLGAAGLGDIGVHFPPGDPQYKGISSIKLLERVGGMLAERGWKVGNIDVVVAAEQPRLRDYISAMCYNLSKVLGIEASAVNVKASTTEELGFVGREEGMATWATVLIEKI